MKLFKILFFISLFSLTTLAQTNSISNIVPKNERPHQGINGKIPIEFCHRIM